MRSYAGFATWAASAPQDVLAQLGIRYRRPSEKTFRTVLSHLDAADLDRRLGAYFTALAVAQAAAGDALLVVALDGKTLRGSRRAGAAAVHVVSVFADRARLVLGQPHPYDQRFREPPPLPLSEGRKAWSSDCSKVGTSGARRVG